MTEDRFNQLIAERQALIDAVKKIDAEIEAADRTFDLMDRILRDGNKAGR